MTDIIADPALFELLKAHVGDNDEGDPKVYADQAPDGETAPFIVYSEVDTSRWRTLNGPSGPVQALFRIDAYDRLPYDAKRLGARIRKALDGYRGVVPYGANSPQDTVDIKGISFQNGSSLTDQTDKPLLYRRTAVFLVSYKED